MLSPVLDFILGSTTVTVPALVAWLWSIIALLCPGATVLTLMVILFDRYLKRSKSD